MSDRNEPEHKQYARKCFSVNNTEEEFRIQKTEFRRQNSEDRRQKTEDRRQKTEEEIEQKIAKETKKKKRQMVRHVVSYLIGS